LLKEICSQLQIKVSGFWVDGKVLQTITYKTEIMKITVNYQSGQRQTFIVPKNMLALDFRKLAEEIGGKIDNIEFSLANNQVGFYDNEMRESLLYPE